MLRMAATAAVLALCSALPALAQGYPHEPPPGYMSAPPPGWAHRDFWRHKKEADRRAFWAEWRRESWRCDHHDRPACRWLHTHANG